MARAGATFTKEWTGHMVGRRGATWRLTGVDVDTLALPPRVTERWLCVQSAPVVGGSAGGGNGGDPPDDDKKAAPDDDDKKPAPDDKKPAPDPAPDDKKPDEALPPSKRPCCRAS